MMVSGELKLLRRPGDDEQRERDEKFDDACREIGHLMGDQYGPSAPPTESDDNLYELHQRLAHEERVNGMTGFRISWGPEAALLSSEDRAAIVLKHLQQIEDGECQEIDLAELDGRIPAVSVKDFLAQHQKTEHT